MQVIVDEGIGESSPLWQRFQAWLGPRSAKIGPIKQRPRSPRRPPAARGSRPRLAAKDCEAQAVSPQMPRERQTSSRVFALKSVLLQTCHQGHAGDKHHDHSDATASPRVQPYLQPQ
jgi:hypothetical protein